MASPWFPTDLAEATREPKQPTPKGQWQIAPLQVMLRLGPFSTGILFLFRIQCWCHTSSMYSICDICGRGHLQKCQEYWVVCLYDIPWFKISPLPLPSFLSSPLIFFLPSFSPSLPTSFSSSLSSSFSFFLTFQDWVLRRCSG